MNIPEAPSRVCIAKKYVNKGMLIGIAANGGALHIGNGLEVEVVAREDGNYVVQLFQVEIGGAPVKQTYRRTKKVVQKQPAKEKNKGLIAESSDDVAGESLW